MKIHQYMDQKGKKKKYLKKSLSRVVYGCLMATTAVILVALDPITIATDWYLDIKEDSFLYKMWRAPSYELFLDVWVFNYTNVQNYLQGDTKILRVQEIGPFKFRELRTNENMTIVKERGVLSMKPKIKLNYLKEESVSKLKDLTITVPNIALIAMSTLAADQLGYIGNSAVYYTTLTSGATLFKDVTIEQLLWGYQDPVVLAANKLLPGWIDFNKLGILDRFYSQRPDVLDIEVGDKSKRFSIRSWNDSPGLKEQGFVDVNTSIPCNLIKGSYEGFTLTPGYPKGKEIRIYRKQACRIYPFLYQREFLSEYGFNVRRYVMAESAFSKKSPYACLCTYNCLPEGFVDVKNCYYGFPIALSKPHFQDVDPIQRSYFEGMTPNPENTSFFHIEPTTGSPTALESKMQINLAVRMSPGNPITKPLKDKVLPLIWVSIYCKHPPPEVVSLLRIRFVIAPPLLITLEVILFVVGFFLGVHGFYRFWKVDSGKDWKENVDGKKSTENCIDVERQIMILGVANYTGAKDEELDKDHSLSCIN